MEEDKKKVTMQKPNASLEELYADAKQTITLGVRNLIRAFPLPIFMIESILQSILLEYRNEAYMELATCVDEHKQKTEEYYEAKIKEMAEQFEKEREELIQSFEKQEPVKEELEKAEPVKQEPETPEQKEQIVSKKKKS